MPYGLPPRIDGEEPKVVGGEGSQTPTSEGNESPGTLPTTPERTAHSPGSSQEEGPDDLFFTTPPEEDRPSGTLRGSLVKGEKETNEDFLEMLDELIEPPNWPAPIGAPSETESPPPAGSGASIEDTSPPVEDEREQPSEPEPATASMRPSSPAAAEEDDPTVPPFQFTQPLNQSIDSRRDDFQSPVGEVTRPYQRHLGITSMRTSDWTYYHAQDEADPTAYHPDWPTGMRQLGPFRGSARSKSWARIPPLSPTYLGRTLWRKIADLKQQKSCGNSQERLGILQHMRTTEKAIKSDPDWATTLRRCREDPTEDYLHTVLPTGEVLPFSEAVAIAYEYPCTLGKQQEGLHRRIVFSSTTGIPLITPALSGRLRLQDRRRSALELLMTQKDRVGYFGDEVCGEDRPNPDIVPNRWNRPRHHY